MTSFSAGKNNLVLELSVVLFVQNFEVDLRLEKKKGDKCWWPSASTFKRTNEATCPIGKKWSRTRPDSFPTRTPPTHSLLESSRYDFFVRWVLYYGWRLKPFKDTDFCYREDMLLMGSSGEFVGIINFLKSFIYHLKILKQDTLLM